MIHTRRPIFGCAATASLAVLLTGCPGGALPSGECVFNDECEDGLFCNGAEICVDGSCRAGGSPCGGTQVCNEAANACDNGAGSPASRITSAITRDGATAVIADPANNFVALVRSESVVMLGDDGVRMHFSDGTTLQIRQVVTGCDDYDFRNQAEGAIEGLRICITPSLKTREVIPVDSEQNYAVDAEPSLSARTASDEFGMRSMPDGRSHLGLASAPKKLAGMLKEIEDCVLDFSELEPYFDCVSQSYRDMAAGHLERLANGLREAADDFGLGNVRQRGIDLATNWTQNVADFLRNGEVDPVDLFDRALGNETVTDLLDIYRQGVSSTPYEFQPGSASGTLRDSSLRQATENLLRRTNDSTIMNPTNVTIDDVFCNPGTVFDLPSGTCRSQSECVPISCNPGSSFDLAACDCVPDAGITCPPGTTPNEITGDCRTPDGCTAGSVLVENPFDPGDGLGCCPPGHIAAGFDGNTLCCPSNEPFRQPDGRCTATPDGCPQGFTLGSGGDCRNAEGCPQGFPFLVNGFCFLTPNPCPPGTSVSSADGSCQTPEGCPGDKPFLISGFCFSTQNPCQPGSEVGSDGQCVQGCPPNSFRDSSSGRCTCSSGFSVCADGSACVPSRGCPDNSSPSCNGDGCNCNDGFVIDVNRTRCWAEVNCGSGALPSDDGRCVCGPGYVSTGTTCEIRDRDCSRCEAGSCQPVNAPAVGCCTLDSPYLWGDNTCRSEPPSTSCSDPSGIRCSCPDTHFCIGNWCNGVLWHADGISCGGVDCNN